MKRTRILVAAFLAVTSFVAVAQADSEVMTDQQLDQVVAGELVTYNVYINNGGQIALKLPGERLGKNWQPVYIELEQVTLDCDTSLGTCDYNSGEKVFTWNGSDWD
jgi:hypothetical protein